jgi:putative FmdB family regulatory protein
MPIYVYRCSQCGEEFEELIMSAQKADRITCPFCQSKEVVRRPALFGLGGKGSSASTADSCQPAAGGG